MVFCWSAAGLVGARWSSLILLVFAENATKRCPVIGKAIFCPNRRKVSSRQITAPKGVTLAEALTVAG